MIDRAPVWELLVGVLEGVPVDVDWPLLLLGAVVKILAGPVDDLLSETELTENRAFREVGDPPLSSDSTVVFVNGNLEGLERLLEVNVVILPEDTDDPSPLIEDREARVVEVDRL